MQSKSAVRQTCNENPDHRFRMVSGTGVDFEHLLELCRFIAARVREHQGCGQYHLTNLKNRGETEQRMHELGNWQESLSFTQREKAAFNLSEVLSLNLSDETTKEALAHARLHFEIPKIIHLTLAITAVNEWIDLYGGFPIRVLVVEDSLCDQELLRYQLSKAHLNQNVVFVEDAFKALELLTGPEGDIIRQDLMAIFLDINLPGMNGVELLQRIRRIPRMEDFPVIVMTSINNPRHIEECKRLRVASYVEKPVTFDSFSLAIANIFHQTPVMAETATALRD